MRGSACEATATVVTAIVDFTNEIMIYNDGMSRMESLLALLAGRFLIGCGNGNQMLTRGRGFNIRIDAGGRRNERQSGCRRKYVDGIDPCPWTVSWRTRRASYTLNNPAPDDTMCHVARGMMMMYLREDNLASLLWQSSSEALTVIQTAMNLGLKILFLKGSSDSEYSFSGVRVVRYVRGMPNGNEGMYFIDHSDSNSYGGGNVEGANIKGASALKNVEVSSRIYDMTDPIDVIDGMDGLCYRLQEIICYIFWWRGDLAII